MKIFKWIEERSKRRVWWIRCSSLILYKIVKTLFGYNGVKKLLIKKYVNYKFELLIRAVRPKLIAHELVSVQPMTYKVGSIFRLHYISPFSRKWSSWTGLKFQWKET